MQAWRVLIVEDDVETREFFAASVRAHDRLALFGTAGSIGEALALLDGQHDGPDVLLVDLGLPDGSGLRVIEWAAAHLPGCEALVISMFGDEDNVLASIEAGALGYIHKDSGPQDIAQTILEMKAGGSPISPMVARRVLARYHVGARVPPERAAATPARDATATPTLLSAREAQVLDLIARGFSYQEISQLERISIHTVQTHIKSLYRKLAVHSRSEAVFEASRMGLLPLRG